MRSFREITLKQLRIHYWRLYNMCHADASIGLMSGTKPAFLAGQFRHSLRMFSDVYAN